MSVTKTTSIIYGLDVSNLDYLDLDENDMYEKYSRYNQPQDYVYLSGDGDDYFGIVVDMVEEGSYTIEHLTTWSFTEIQEAVPLAARQKLLEFVQKQFAEPDDGFKIDFMITVTYS